MKKTRLLTSIVTLALVLSLGACHIEDDTTTSDFGSGDNNDESRLGLLEQAFKLVGQANYTLTCYSTAINTDDHLSYKGVVTDVGAISTSYTGSTTGMINDPDDGGLVEVTLDGDLIRATATPDTSRSVQDYYISSNIDTALFEELEDGRFALKDEGFTSDVLQDLFPDRPFTGGLITPLQGSIFIDVEDDLSKVTYYYDSNLNGSFTVTLVVENLGTTVFPYDLSTQYVKAGSEEVTSWATFLDSSLKASVDELLGADLDDVLPFYVPESGYSYTGFWSGKFNLTYSGDASVWVSPLLEFGYVEVSANAEYLFIGEVYNYIVTLSSFWGSTDLYLYPVEKGDDLEVANAIIEAINDNGVSWDAFYGERNNEIAYLANDENRSTYGIIYAYRNDKLSTESYYVDNVRYIHDIAEDSSNDTYQIATAGIPPISSYFNTYYSDIFEVTEDIDFDDEDYSFTLTNNGTGYTLVVDYSFLNFSNQLTSGTFTYVVDSHYNLFEFEYEYTSVDKTTVREYAKEITLGDVEEVLSDLDLSKWYPDYGKNPSDLFTKISEGAGYTVTIDYEQSESVETMDYEEYAPNSNAYEQDPYSCPLFDNMVSVNTERYVINYTTDAVHVTKYVLEDNSYLYDSEEIYLDDNGYYYYYQTSDGDNWSYESFEGSLTSSIETVFTLYEYFIDSFTYSESKVNERGHYDEYLVAMSSMSYQWYFMAIGTQFVFPNYMVTASHYEIAETNFYFVDQEMVTNYNSRGFGFDDEDYPSEVTGLDDELYISLSSVGTTDNSYCYQIHNAYHN